MDKKPLVDQAIYHALLDESSDPIFCFDPQGTYLYMNNVFARTVGGVPEDFIGKRIWDVFPGEEGDHRFRAVKHVFETGEQKVLEVKVPKGSEFLWFITTVTPLFDENHGVKTVLCISKNITELKKTQMALEKSEQDFRKLFEVNPFPLMITRVADATLVAANAAAKEFFQLEKQHDAPVHIARHLGLDAQRDTILEMLKEGIVQNYPHEFELDGSKHSVLFNAVLLQYNDESCILSGTADVSAMKAMESQLRHMATTDALTGILNRRMGLDCLEKLFHTAQEQQLGFEICYMDINGLKVVNDKYGHAVGDELIRDVAVLLTTHLPAGGAIARLGGDEFMAIYALNDIGAAETMIQSLRIGMQHLNSRTHVPYTVSLSHGIGVYDPTKPDTVHQLVERADQEMYKRKRALKNIISLSQSERIAGHGE